MTGSTQPNLPVDFAAPPPWPDRDQSGPPVHPARRTDHRAGRWLITTAAMVLLAVLVVALLDAAGFDRRIAAASIGVLAADILVSWYLIARANRGAPRRPTRTGTQH
jgi:hypothetical protein